MPERPPPFDPDATRGAGGAHSGAERDPGPGPDPSGGGRRADDADPAADAWRALRDGLNAAATSSGHGGELQCVELCPICRAADVLRASGPPELRGQISDFQREALTTLRALLDHYIERLDERPAPNQTVEEIPID